MTNLDAAKIASSIKSLDMALFGNSVPAAVREARTLLVNALSESGWEIDLHYTLVKIPVTKTIGKWTVTIDKNQWHDGYFAHENGRDDCGGELWFDGRRLRDYDGMYELPKEVCDALVGMGYTVGPEFYPEVSETDEK